MKTMQDLENQAFELSEKNWKRKNVWASEDASKEAKKNRDILICKAYNAASVALLKVKAKEIDSRLSVRIIGDSMMLDFNTPAAGFGLMVSDAFSIEKFLNNPEKVIKKINA